MRRGRLGLLLLCALLLAARAVADQDTDSGGSEGEPAEECFNQDGSPCDVPCTNEDGTPCDGPPPCVNEDGTPCEQQGCVKDDGTPCDDPACVDADGRPCDDQGGSQGCINADGTPCNDQGGSQGCVNADGSPCDGGGGNPCRDDAGNWNCSACYRPDGAPVRLASGRPACPKCFVTADDGSLADLLDKTTGVPVCACSRDPACDACQRLYQGPCVDDPEGVACSDWWAGGGNSGLEAPDSPPCYEDGGALAVLEGGAAVCPWCADGTGQEALDKWTGVPTCACIKDAASADCQTLTGGPCVQDALSQACADWNATFGPVDGGGWLCGGADAEAPNGRPCLPVYVERPSEAVPGEAEADVGGGGGSGGSSGPRDKRPVMPGSASGAGPAIKRVPKPRPNSSPKPKPSPKPDVRVCTARCPTFTRAPVCGRDGKRYAGSCEAKCAGTTSKCTCGSPSCRTGACGRACKGVLVAPGKQPEPPSCVCDKSWRPVCGANGKVYSNACTAKCDAAKAGKTCACGKCAGAACKAACGKAKKPVTPPQRPCNCSTTSKPMCAVDGRVYRNACLARCAGTTNQFMCGKQGEAACKKRCKPATTADNCVCTEIYAPVCSANGTVYSNACVARCAKQKPRFACGSLTGCTAACKKAAAAPTCKCTVGALKDTVCGYDGQLYPTRSCLSCNGVPLRFACKARKGCKSLCESKGRLP